MELHVVDIDAVRSAIEAVEDPEIHRSLGDLGMVRELSVADGTVSVLVALTIPGCPLKDQLDADVTAAASSIEGVTSVEVSFTSMSDEERSALTAELRGAAGASREITIAQPGSGTRVIGVASGKGGVGKSSVTANLGIALAGRGFRVGIIDADVWGFSIPKMLGIDRAPTVLDDMLLPPEAHGVAVISMDFFVQPDQAVVWRGPMLHKALEQFLVDVHWGDLDYLLIDMPPGTGDVAISISQYLPRSEILVVTTPQPTAQRVAVRAGLMARKVNQDIIGVIENMSWFTGDDGKHYEIFGAGGGAELAEQLGVDLLGKVPLVTAMREGADAGKPITVTDPSGEAAEAFDRIADELVARGPRLRSHPELVIS
ncbi:MAG: Mrp/NBP35 family ATP-binding protein [Deltaproteobacteria bacterium]|jgi:ATP-binding protein involved in chromosome partitioning|nr:Mrp/NBP35 family ATP-binding protein [Deltaproteobacteria bacterium]